VPGGVTAGAPPESSPGVSLGVNPSRGGGGVVREGGLGLGLGLRVDPEPGLTLSLHPRTGPRRCPCTSSRGGILVKKEGLRLG